MSKTPPPSTDLQVLNLGVKALTEPTVVEGAIKKRKDAITNGDLWTLSGRQDDALVVANDDKLRVRQFVADATAAIERGRRPACKAWNFVCRWKRKDEDDSPRTGSPD